MSAELDSVIEATNEINSEATPEEVVKPKTEEVANAREALPSVKQEAKHEVKQEVVKQETPKEPAKEEEDFKNKTERLKNKKVKCEGCNMEMTLKTLRYSHKCVGKTEDKAVRPKAKAKSKITAVAIKPIQNEVIEETEPTYLKEVKQKVIREPAQPVKMKTPQEIISDNYKILHQEYMEKRKEKADNLFKSMFVGNTRRKKR